MFINKFFTIIIAIFKSKIVFKDPEQHKLVIFDDEGFDDLEHLIKDHDDYFILQVRFYKINKFYVSFNILKNLTKNYFRIKKNKKIFNAYLITLIEMVKPKTVLTIIDNSIKFWELAKFFEENINFVAIQNGSRNFEKKNYSEEKHKGFIPHFFCYGEYEIDYYKKWGFKVKNFYPSGSLRLANFFKFMEEKMINIENYSSDICLVAEEMNDYEKKFNDPNFSKNFVKVIKYAIQFCSNNNKKMIFALKRDIKRTPIHYENEINFFKRHLNKEEFSYLMENTIEKSKEEFTSYLSIYFSKVTLGTQSTLLREKLSMGGKILSCNLSKYSVFNFPIEGICTLNNCSYEEFEKRLIEILNISNKEYIAKLNRKHTYIMHYDPNYSIIESVKDKFLHLNDN